MTLSRSWFLALGFLLVVSSLQAGTRDTAFQARAMLGSGIWSRVVRLENAKAGPGSRYPSEFHALVVAFEGILWLYTEFDGTQTLSRYSGRLEQDQADIGPLLREIEPGLGQYEDVTDRAPEQIPQAAPPYACFLASVARWQQLRNDAVPPTRARLLAYYPRGERQGHMVLEYWRDGKRYVFDPDRPNHEREMSTRLADDPLRVAQALYRPDDRKRPVRASHLELTSPEPPNEV
jgi:hypothetical protein